MRAAIEVRTSHTAAHPQAAAPEYLPIIHAAACMHVVRKQHALHSEKQQFVRAARRTPLRFTLSRALVGLAYTKWATGVS